MGIFAGKATCPLHAGTVLAIKMDGFYCTIPYIQGVVEFRAPKITFLDCLTILGPLRLIILGHSSSFTLLDRFFVLTSGGRYRLKNLRFFFTPSVYFTLEDIFTSIGVLIKKKIFSDIRTRSQKEK